MAAAAWERFVGHRWLPKAAVVVLAAVLVAAFLLVRSERRDAHNAGVLETACGGVLPRETVRGLLPGDETWELRSDLDLTGPSGRGPRTLVRCSLDWGEYGGLELAAVPVLDVPPRGVRPRDILSAGTAKEPDRATAYRTATTQVTVGCPAGLAGYPRPVTRFRVHASLNHDDGSEVAGAAKELGTVVTAVADHVRDRGGCGGPAVKPSDVRPGPGRVAEDSEDSDEVPRACRWFRPGMLDGKWDPAEPDADGVTSDDADACSLSVRRTKPANRYDLTAGVSSVSWRGPLLPEVRTVYGAELAALSPAPEPKSGEKSYVLAVWAESSCSGARTLSRVRVETAASALAADRADRILDAYLASSDCRAVKVLGKVWK
ncbi:MULTISPECIES: hypothetical protein [Streptomyces]|uniref:hypothetical protein n=1 Tax=Streptomyces TaxID=1883 RepID=UPI001B380E1D|nr:MULTISPECIES: hypothetical protein [unclassified Streptomyces]MBQ1114304.1 hypothetical protein [Streptomyces sp. C3-3]MDX3487612.1 hypothetical protein [Streptomyces sp. ID05-18]